MTQLYCVMLSTILSAATVGLDGVLIKVEVDVAERGFPTFTRVGTQYQQSSLKLLKRYHQEENKERIYNLFYSKLLPIRIDIV